MSGLRFSDLSRARQDLVRLCQNVIYGQLIGISIKQGDPVLDPPPTILIDVKLDSSDDPRGEVALPDFALREEIIRLRGGSISWATVLSTDSRFALASHTE